MDGIKSLLNSEKALALGALVIGATVLTAIGKMTIAEWQSYTTYLAGFYVAGKTVQSGVDAMANAKIEAAKHAAGTISAEVVSAAVAEIKHPPPLLPTP